MDTRSGRSVLSPLSAGRFPYLATPYCESRRADKEGKLKKLLFAGVAAGMLALAVPAQAHPNYHYEGGCGFQTLSDGGEDDQTTWTGSAQAAVVATDAAGVPAAVSISVECHVYKNGVYQNTILSASGTGVAATASEYEYQAAPSDIITVCDVVTVGGEPHTNCGDATTTPIVPEPVQEAIEGIFNEVDAIVIEHVDPTLCEVLKLLKPGVPGVLDITDEGDVYIAGEFFWDCFPYAV